MLHNHNMSWMKLLLCGWMGISAMMPLSLHAAEDYHWEKIEGRWFYTSQNGNYVTGWKKINGQWYFFDDDGSMIQDVIALIDGNLYVFQSDGTMKTGWYKDRASWLYFGNDGALASTWKKIDGNWYYFRSTGHMTVGWARIGSAWYYFASTGEMLTGTRKIHNATCTFASDGALISSKTPPASAYPSTLSAQMYEQKVDEFITDYRWCDGADYGMGHPSYLGPKGYTECAGYAADFVAYVFGRQMNVFQREFTSTAEIRSGDVLRLDPAHSIVVLYRDGNDLVVAEGNVNLHARVTADCYSIDGDYILFYGMPMYKLDYGQHYLPAGLY